MASVLTFSGCAEAKTARVAGTVTFDGKPLPSGLISFTSEKGSSSSSAIEDGKYAVTDAVIGPVTITVETSAPSSSNAQKAVILKSADGKEIGTPPKVSIAIPSRYAKAETSDLKYTVLKGEQAHNVELKP